MNVSKARNSQKRSSETADKGRAVAGKAAVSFGKMLATVLLVFVLAGCISVCVMISYIMSFADSRLDIPLEDLKQDYTSTIYAYDGEVGDYVALENLYSTENRVWVDFNEIPDHVFDAFVAVEDQRFNEHDGVDWKRTILSFVNLVVPLYDRKSGGSTITQQLIKNITGDDDVRIDRKIREIMMAINLEKDYDKDVILLTYVNKIYLGAHSYGVQAAAQTYFDKDVGELTIAEAACLAGIVQNPTKRNPFTNPEKNRERQEYALKKMLELGFISQEEYDEAMAQEMVFAEEKYTTELYSRQSYFVDEVRRQVVEELCEKNDWTQTHAENKLLTGGYKIYATIDTEIQQIMDSVYADEATFEAFDGDEEQPQSAMVIMQSDGKVVGVVGGRGEKSYDMSLNYATMTVRQPGSSIKPLTAYSAGIEENLFTYSTLFNDRNLKTDESWTLFGTWMPKNSYSAFKGWIPLSEALAYSSNVTAAISVVDYITPELAFEYGYNKYMLKTLVESKTANGKSFTDKSAAPMAIGAVTDGVIVEDMVAAYQAFANGGYYHEPYYYTEVYDSDNNLVLAHEDKAQRVISEDTSYIMNKLLEHNVTMKGGTCAAMKLSKSGVTSAGKTGTTDDNKDKWCLGFTPYYVGGVWMGYESYTTDSRLPGTNYSVRIWAKIMDEIHTAKGLENKTVQDQPASVLTRHYCKATGLIAGPNCLNTEVGYYRKSNMPETCNLGYDHSKPEDVIVLDTPSDTDSSDGSIELPDETTDTSSDFSSENVTTEPPVPDASEIIPQAQARKRKAA